MISQVLFLPEMRNILNRYNQVAYFFFGSTKYPIKKKIDSFRGVAKNIPFLSYARGVVGAEKLACKSC